VPDASRAFEFHGPWRLDLSATHYRPEAVKRTSVERGVVRLVATRSGQLSTQALYRVRSAAQRLALRLPEGVQFDTDPLRINGRPVVLERGDKGELFIPLVGRNPDEPFLLELRYSVEGGPSRLEIPELPGEPAVQKVYLCAYLPEEWALLGSRGPWTEERRRDDAGLVSWVSEGIKLEGNPADSFSHDGKLVVFSTLQPEAAPGGTLRLVTFDRRGVQLGLFAVVVVLGLVFVRRRWVERLALVAVLAIVVVLLGTLAPTFAEYVLDRRLILAVFVVLAVWVFASAFESIRREHRLRSQAIQANESPPTAEPPPVGAAVQPSPPAGSSQPLEGGEHHA
jgi:hypothetical protein